jgi:broad specificity phosphatase PhoE
MVKVYLIRHAQSELNLLKEKTAKQFGLSLNEDALYLGYKFINKDHLMDAQISKLGELQCQIANLENKEKFKKVKQNSEYNF